MTIDFWVVGYENTNDGEPEIYKTDNEAYNAMRLALIRYGKWYHFESEEIDLALKDMANEFNDRFENDYFGGQLGECGAHAYKKSVRI